MRQRNGMGFHGLFSGRAFAFRWLFLSFFSSFFSPLNGRVVWLFLFWKSWYKWLVIIHELHFHKFVEKVL